MICCNYLRFQTVWVAWTVTLLYGTAPRIWWVRTCDQALSLPPWLLYQQWGLTLPRQIFWLYRSAYHSRIHHPPPQLCVDKPTFVNSCQRKANKLQLPDPQCLTDSVFTQVDSFPCIHEQYSDCIVEFICIFSYIRVLIVSFVACESLQGLLIE